MDSMITASVKGRPGKSSTLAPRCPTTVSISLARRASISGWRPMRYKVHESANAVVSWPASSSVMISSRSWVSDIALPFSSRACINIDKRSPESVGLSCRSRMMRSTTFSTLRKPRRYRMWPGRTSRARLSLSLVNEKRSRHWKRSYSAPTCVALRGGRIRQKGNYVFEKQDTYTPAEAKRANEQLDRLVAAKTITPRQAGAYRMHIARRTRVALKPSYTAQSAKRAKSEIVKLTETGTITPKSAVAYRAHITKRTIAA
jgi:hypothetical protein